MEDNAPFPGDSEFFVGSLRGEESFDVIDQIVFECLIKDDLVPIGGFDAFEKLGATSPLFLIVDEDGVVRDAEVTGCACYEVFYDGVAPLGGESRRGGGLVKDVMGFDFVEIFQVAGCVDYEVVAGPVVIVFAEPDGVAVGAWICGKAAWWRVEATQGNVLVCEVEDGFCFAGVG